ncbi:MAG: VWA domain-containing protein [Acidobacteria bacterium]|nr:MAG: VWA domain-containing protein [Acidobacteriota bacterium]
MRYKYSRFTGEDLEGVDLDELFSKLSDLLLFSGFSMSPMSPWPDSDRSMQALHDAIMEALLNGEVLPDGTLDRLLAEGADPQQLEQLIKELIERLEQEGYITTAPDLQAAREQRQAGGVGSLSGENAPPLQFEVTDRGLDFLGYRALRDLLGSLGKSSFGRHDTRDLSTGVEANGAAKPYEFGDTMNLDLSGTILNAVRRAGEEGRLGPGRAGAIEVQHRDLMVAQGEYQSSCATVLMLDCSHSMILYGEDRFTPAKRVALALANLIRLQYPGDSLNLVLFHDSAEEIPLKELARVRVGPYYTNTREGLRMAQRILQRQRKDMKQIVMITDGKPSALTLEDGRIYKNAFGLDPLVVSETLEEVSKCKRAGILINTFMLASDYGLIQFVQKVTQMCRGKAYFTTPYTLGQYLLLDYMTRKTRTIH